MHCGDGQKLKVLIQPVLHFIMQRLVRNESGSWKNYYERIKFEYLSCLSLAFQKSHWESEEGNGLVVFFYLYIDRWKVESCWRRKKRKIRENEILF